MGITFRLEKLAWELQNLTRSKKKAASGQRT
jgi:hypothetical protein